METAIGTNLFWPPYLNTGSNVDLITIRRRINPEGVIELHVPSLIESGPLRGIRLSSIIHLRD